MPFLIAKIVSAGSATHGLCVFGSGFVYQMNVTHRRLSLVTVLMVLLHGHGLGRCSLSWCLHPPGRHARGGRLSPLRCGSGRGQLCQSYSINIFGLSTSWPLPPPGYAQGNAVRRNDDAVLRGAVGAEDDGTRVVHNSTAT